MNAGSAAAKVADARPRFGSITQSSNAINSITQDRVTVTTEYGATQNTYSVENGSAWSISTANGNPQRIETTGHFEGSELNRQVNGGTLWVDVYSDIEAPTTSGVDGGVGSILSPGQSVRYTGGGNNLTFTVRADGTGCVGSSICAGNSLNINNFRAERNNQGNWEIISLPSGAMPVGSGGNPVKDTDYLAGGIWLFVPNNPASADDFVFGAFGDGSDPFMQSALPALTGTARYIGEATGIYSATENNATQIGYFDANATLDADFGDGNGLGTIGGHLTGFEVDGESLPGSLTLGSANIGASNSGFFEGRLSGSSQGTSYTGRWGGAFFGNGEDDGRPGSVGGTFGGRSADSSESFVGAFGAYKSSSRP
ncbi:MAG: hypothetical protein OXI53_07880 [Nitrospira sp.]|nr:hypothetical protein [Nitrospira sp.]